MRMIYSRFSPNTAFALLRPVLRGLVMGLCIVLPALFCTGTQAVEPTRLPAVTEPMVIPPQTNATVVTRPDVTIDTMIVTKKPGELIAAYCTLSAPVTEPELGLLADEIFEHLQGKLYTWVAINWYLPDHPKGIKPWAISNFGEGDRLVQILDGRHEQKKRRTSIPEKYLPKN